jgi:cytochrome d ubiquinol oxidase subunit II
MGRTGADKEQAVHLYEIPLIFVLIGLVLYTVLAGADFGAGLWKLFAGGGPSGARIRDHAHHSMAPVWEANHVWLIFVLTVMWTSYPTAFSSIASTLCVPLFMAGIGIVFRGATYALRAGTRTAAELSLVDTVFSISSILTPFALGAVIGAIASRRVPVGNAAGHLFSSWTGPTSLLVGTLALASAAYLAAVYLAADAARHGESELERSFRLRALIAGVAAGALALGGILVLRTDAHPLYHHLVAGAGVIGLTCSMLAGIATILLVWRSCFEQARFTAALAVAAIILGWALAQQPLLLPGLTVSQAAAPHDTLVAVIVAVIAGGVVLFPSLALLFRLLLHGQLDHVRPDQPAPAHTAARALTASRSSRVLARLCVASLIGGFALLTLADSSWAHAVGVVCLLAFVIGGFFALELGRDADPETLTEE